MADIAQHDYQDLCAALGLSLGACERRHIRERVDEGNRVLRLHGCTNAELMVQDLTSPEFFLPAAQFYFLYDYGKVEHIRRTLQQLADIADHSRFTVIARGKGSRSIIDLEHPWLSCAQDQVGPNYSVYTF